jgi:hypothetical protein
MYSLAQQSMVSEPSAVDLATTLAQAHSFSLAALAANRAGKLAPEQAAALRRRALRRLLLGLTTVGGALLLAVAVGVAEGARIFAQMLLFCGIIALCGGRVIAMGVRALQDARGGAVAALEGSVTKSRSVDTDEAGNSTMMYYYHVGRQKFRVTSAAYMALPSGAICRLYYSPGVRELLSIEPVAAPDAWRSAQ